MTVARWLLFRSLVNQVHKLVKFWSDNDLRATVTLLANLCIVGGDRVELSTSASSQSLGLYSEMVDEILDYR